MGIITWIIVGGIAGWLASMIAGNNAQQGVLGNIIVGILGAFLGGLIVSLFGGEGFSGFNLWSLLVATLGATVLLFIVRGFRRGHTV